MKLVMVRSVARFEDWKAKADSSALASARAKRVSRMAWATTVMPRESSSRVGLKALPLRETVS
jgi:hypothetical protein